MKQFLGFLMKGEGGLFHKLNLTKSNLFSKTYKDILILVMTYLFTLALWDLYI